MFSLRILIPILFLVLALAQSALIAHFADATFREELVESVVDTLNSQMTRHQDTLQYLLRKRDYERAQQEISALGSDLTVTFAALFDDNQRILMSTALDQSGMSLAEGVAQLPKDDIPKIYDEYMSALSLMQGKSWVGSSDASLYAAYPVVFNNAPAGPRPTKTGIFFVAKDLASIRQGAKAEFVSRLHVVVGALFAAAVAVALLIHFVVSRRIRTLVDTTARFAKGDYEARAPIVGMDELTQLSYGFNRMAHDIAAQRRQVEEERELRQLLLDSTAEAIYGIDTNGRCTFANPACLRILGYDKIEQLIGRNMHNLTHYRYPDGRPYHEKDCNLLKAVLAGETSHSKDDVFFKRDGSAVPVEFWAHPIWQNNAVIGAVVTYFDISEAIALTAELDAYRNNLEQLVAKRTAELNASNRELESYSYSIAHDLRAPLRGITGFSQILLDEASPKLTEEHQDHLKRIIRAGKHMADLIKDILDLSRITRASIHRQNVNVTKLAEDVVEQLRPVYAAQKACVEIDPKLHGFADRNLLRMALENLIGNAFKFSGKSEQPCVKVGQLHGQDPVVFFVRDNGIGFDMQFAEKLFRPFERLHSDSNFEGTGVGLASVQRVIHRHGGEIWAEAMPDSGATFYFTLGSRRQGSTRFEKVELQRKVS